jgi:hypothetical protein
VEADASPPIKAEIVAESIVSVLKILKIKSDKKVFDGTRVAIGYSKGCCFGSALK